MEQQYGYNCVEYSLHRSFFRLKRDFQRISIWRFCIKTYRKWRNLPPNENMPKFNKKQSYGSSKVIPVFALGPWSEAVCPTGNFEARRK